jgi:hypothetical protein
MLCRNVVMPLTIDAAHMPEERNPQLHRCENLKTRIVEYVEIQFATLTPTKCAVLFLRYLYYNITKYFYIFRSPTDHHQGTNQSNTALH